MIIKNKIDTPDNVDSWKKALPFNHIVIDNFLDSDLIDIVDKEFPDPDSSFWFEYANKIEIKKACSDWNRLPGSIYKTISHLLSNEVTQQVSKLCGVPLYPDYGLHGGGIHCHKAGGKLNTHLDYSIHPKLGTMRKVNIIIYTKKDWDPKWDGALGFWSHDEAAKQPGELVKKVDCLFNRAVIFDTTQNSWHGLPDPVRCPENISRNSIAVYYTCEPSTDDFRKKALFAPSADQRGDKEVEELIAKRANINTAGDVYKKK